MLLIPLKTNRADDVRVVYLRTTPGAAPSGTAVPDLQRADPRQGISRRSCMLMRRILLEVGRGLRTRVRQLGSCFHSPGAADQADSNIPCPMRFLYYLMNSSNQLHHSNVLRSWIPHLEQPIKQTRTFRVQCVSTLAWCSRL